MEWSDSLIVLNIHKYNDTMSIVSGISSNHGLCSGSIKNSKSNKSSIAIGNILEVSWRGRLENHLGYFRINSCESVYPFIYSNRTKISAMMSICQLFYKALPPKEPHKSLYMYLEDFLYSLKYEDGQWIKRLLFIEIELLSAMGFGFDLDKCAGSGSVENLAYISPKTGRAVSEELGALYKDRLFRLPEIIKDINAEASQEDIIYSLDVTKYFISKHIEMPESRNDLTMILKNQFSSLES